MKKLILLALAGTLILPSCMIEKRHYRNGFYVDFNKRPDAPQPSQTSESEPASISLNGDGKNAVENQMNEYESVHQDAVVTNGGENRPSGSCLHTETLVTEQAPVISSETIKSDSKSNDATHAPDPDFPVWAYILIALFIPPLAVALKYGIHLAFWLCLIFTLLGFVPGLIYALVYLALAGNNPDK